MKTVFSLVLSLGLMMGLNARAVDLAKACKKEIEKNCPTVDVDNADAVTEAARAKPALYRKPALSPWTLPGAIRPGREKWRR